jgi:hypothetical protein
VRWLQHRNICPEAGRVTGLPFKHLNLSTRPRRNAEVELLSAVMRAGCIILTADLRQDITSAENACSLHTHKLVIEAAQRWLESTHLVEEVRDSGLPITLQVKGCEKRKCRVDQDHLYGNSVPTVFLAERLPHLYTFLFGITRYMCITLANQVDEHCGGSAGWACQSPGMLASNLMMLGTCNGAMWYCGVKLSKEVGARPVSKDTCECWVHS